MKTSNELAICGGRILGDDGFYEADVVVCDGKIVDVGQGVARNVDAVHHVDGAWVLPGAVDAHVHFNEPGRTHWEGFASGSRALAAGGSTSFIDMPLNASPPTLDRVSFELKRTAGEANSCLDFALWGGLTPDNLADLRGLAACGVVGFKAFIISSGIDDFLCVDARVLREGMRVAAELGLPVAVHAEDAAVVAASTAEVQRTGKSDARAFLASRPVGSEIAATRMALDIAGETGCSVHIVHAGCPEVVELVRAAWMAGADATVEVCYHHALLDITATDTHGAIAKCAPPLRDAASRDALANLIFDGRVDGLGSDHSPAPPDLKAGRSFWDAWGGIMGCQHGLLLLADRAIRERGESGLVSVWRAASVLPAARWGLGDRKGQIARGCDADIVILESCPPTKIESASLLYRHQTSPYVGMSLGLAVRDIFCRGNRLGRGGECLPPGGAKFLTRRV